MHGASRGAAGPSSKPASRSKTPHFGANEGSPERVMARLCGTVTIAEVAVHRIGRIEIMLEWRPRLIALVALTVLLAIALASGYGLPFDDIPVADNWEW